MKPGETRIDLERLSRERLDQLFRILEEVLDLDSEAIPPVLDRLCAGDLELRAQVQALLDADRGSRNFLTRPAMDWIPGLVLEDREGSGEPDRDGARVGAWRILRELGRGGMGRVYLAERADGQFEQRVAIKILKRGLDTDEILARFLQERQILARLEHPHIARLIDGGVTEDGLPWFALEHVEGTPITTYGDQHPGPLRDTLRLFVQVCRAVQFAHTNLVIHRDLKPGNILVSDRGEAKLLDFGIAKLLDPLGSTEPSKDRTLGFLRLMTPIYAAPEQVRGTPPTTATDVYSLGVVLYELLTGEKPYRKSTATPDEARRAILEEIPEAPSTRLRRAAAVGRRAGWARLARGDLDNIVLQAIRKEPERRYPSAEGLADDIERHLAGQPVRASGNRVGYVAAKFIQRNRAGVAAAALVLVSLAGGLIATAWQARVAARERDRALLEVKKATEIKDFTLGLFQVSDPSESRGASISARDLLERGTARADEELRGQPAVRGEMLQVLASVYWKLGDYGRAESLAVRAADLARRTAGPRSEALAGALHWVGIARRDRADYPASKAALREALAIRKANGGERQRTYAETLAELSATFRVEGELDSAEVNYRKTLEIDRAIMSEDDVQLAADAVNLGVLLIDQDKAEEAVGWFRKALPIQERKFGHEHPEVANTLSNLGLCYKELSRYGTADSLYAEAIRIRLKTLGPDHIDLATSYTNRAELKRFLGDYAEATALFEKALAIERRALVPDHPDITREVNNLAIVYYMRGLYPLALQRFHECLASRRKTLPPDDRGSLNMEHNIGCVLRGMGRYPEAERTLRNVRARRVKAFGPDNIDISGSDHHLGILCHLTHRDAEAERLLRSALALRDSLTGAESQATAQTVEALASLLRDEHRYKESLALYQRAVTVNEKVFSVPSPQSADALVGLGRLLLETGRAREAESDLRRGLAVRRKSFGEGDLRTAEAAVALGLCVRSQGSAAEAESLLARGLPALRGKPGAPERLLADGTRALASMQGIPSTH